MQTIINDDVLNVTLLEPRRKHPAIFERFDGLEEGENFIILNDHDPKPLYYQLLGERGNIFSWEYLEQGPQWWKVRIGKRKSGEEDQTLGQLAANDLRKAEIFKKYGLDFCCGGKKTVKEACAEKGLDVTRIEQELQQANTNPSRPPAYNEWALDFLCDYIVNNHHSYVRKTLPELITYGAKVASVHGDKHSELIRIQALIEAISSEMSTHMIKEEKVLFPYIKALLNAQHSGLGEMAQFGSVSQPISMMEMEHEGVGRALEEIRSLSRDYLLPEDACASYKLLFKILQEFEEDLHIHVHLENNILFVKALELEKNLEKRP